MDPANPAILYVSTNSGVYKSTNNGGTWAGISTALGFSSISGFGLAPSNPSTLYVATFNGIYQSPDAGASWNAMPGNGLPTTSISSIVVDPSNPTTLYAPINSNSVYGVYKSTDGGANWVTASTGLPSAYINSLIITPTSPATLFATVNSSLYKSIDGGGSWYQSNTGLPTYYGSVSFLAFDPSNPSTLYSGFAGWSLLYKSTNNGNAWSQLTGTGLPTTNSTMQTLSVNPSNSTALMLGSNDGVYLSADTGASWISANDALLAKSIIRIVVAPTTPVTLYALTNTNGSFDWYRRFSGVWSKLTAFTPFLTVAPSNPATLYGTGGSQLMKSIDGGANWSYSIPTIQPPGAIFNRLIADPADPATFYAVVMTGQTTTTLYKSIDGMANWSLSATGLSAQSSIADIIVSQSSPNTVYANITGGGAPGIYKSIDGAGSWNQTPGGGLPASSSLSSLIVDPSNPSTPYVSSWLPSVASSPPASNIYKSTDGGGNWVSITPNPFLPLLVTLASSSTSTLYYATSNSSSAYRSLNGGTSWDQLNSLPAGYYNTVTVDPNNPALLYAATTKGAWQLNSTGNQSINFGQQASVNVGGTGTLSATGGASGNPIVFASLTTSVCTVSGSTVTGVSVGLCTVTANQAGNAFYNAAPQATQNVSINPAGSLLSQTISFGAVPRVLVGGTGTLSATGGASGNPVTFSSQTTGICTVNGSTVTGVAVGTCTIAANQAGNANYSSAVQVTESFNVTAPLFALNISNANIPFGTVSSNIGGIACGSTCSANFASGTKVTLTAIPISGYEFTGWGGACRGYGNSCNITTTNATKTVTANFAVFTIHRPIWKQTIGTIIQRGNLQ